MAYNSSYAEGDIGEAVVNTLVKAILTVGTLITVLVVISLYVYIRKKL